MIYERNKETKLEQVTKTLVIGMGIASLVSFIGIGSYGIIKNDSSYVIAGYNTSAALGLVQLASGITYGISALGKKRN